MARNHSAARALGKIRVDVPVFENISGWAVPDAFHRIRLARVRGTQMGLYPASHLLGSFAGSYADRNALAACQRSGKAEKGNSAEGPLATNS